MASRGLAVWALALASLLAPGRPAEQPESFDVVFAVGNLVGAPAEGEFVVRVHPKWAPLGAARFKDMIDKKFLDGCRFFRVIKGFMAQFGINGDPTVMVRWNGDQIKDDPPYPGVGNTRGRLTFAMAGPGTRTTQLFVNFGDNSYLDKMGFPPFGEVVSGMEVVDRIFVAGESAPEGKGPEPGLIQSRGNAYLDQGFPQLTYIRTARQSGAQGASLSAGSGRMMVHCELTVGGIDIEVHPEWAPLGAARFLDLVEQKYYDGCALFRAVKNFLVQFGISSDPRLREKYKNGPTLQDDPLRPDIPIRLGTMAYAGNGPNSRITQMWIKLEGTDPGLGTRPWETPFAQVVGAESLAALLRINTEYVETVDQGKIWGGYSYLTQNFPRLDYIKECRIQPAPKVEAEPPGGESLLEQQAVAPGDADVVEAAGSPSAPASSSPRLLAFGAGIVALGVAAFVTTRRLKVAGREASDASGKEV